MSSKTSLPKLPDVPIPANIPAILIYGLTLLALPAEGSWVPGMFGLVAILAGNQATKESRRYSEVKATWFLIAGLGLWTFGLALSSVLIAFLGWYLMYPRISGGRLLPRNYAWLAACALPWMQYDLAFLNLHLRLWYAASLEEVCRWLEIPVIREGVHLWLHSLPISIDPPCSGMQSWQILLLSGGFLWLGHLHRWRLLTFPLCLTGLAWALGFLRIFISSMLSLHLPWDSLNEPLHPWIGVALLTFGLSLLALLAPARPKSPLSKTLTLS